MKQDTNDMQYFDLQHIPEVQCYPVHIDKEFKEARDRKEKHWHLSLGVGDELDKSIIRLKEKYKK